MLSPPEPKGSTGGFEIGKWSPGKQSMLHRVPRFPRMREDRGDELLCAEEAWLRLQKPRHELFYSGLSELPLERHH